MQTETITIIPRKELSSEAKSLLKSYCESEDVHSTLFVTYKDIAERVFGWLNKQDNEVYNEVINVLEKELKASESVCFTGRLGRLVSALDGFHPGVRVNISTSDQISNRVLKVIEKCKEENLSSEETKEKITSELKELEISDEDAKAWMSTVDDLEF
jgi:hypothetical protein